MVAAFRPTKTSILGYYDLYSPSKVVSFFKGAVPSLNNSSSFSVSVLDILIWFGNLEG